MAPRHLHSNTRFLVNKSNEHQSSSNGLKTQIPRRKTFSTPTHSLSTTNVKTLPLKRKGKTVKLPEEIFERKTFMIEIVGEFFYFYGKGNLESPGVSGTLGLASDSLAVAHGLSGTLGVRKLFF